MKRYLAALLVCALLLVSSVALADKTGYVNCEGLNIRRRASLSSEVIRCPEYGEKLTVHGDAEDGWYRVTYNGCVRGFVRAEYVVFTKPKGDAPKEDEPQSDPVSASAGASPVEQNPLPEVDETKLAFLQTLGFTAQELLVYCNQKIPEDSKAATLTSSSTTSNDGGRTDTVTVRATGKGISFTCSTSDKSNKDSAWELSGNDYTYEELRDMATVLAIKETVVPEN